MGVKPILDVLLNVETKSEKLIRRREDKELNWLALFPSRFRQCNDRRVRWILLNDCFLLVLYIAILNENKAMNIHLSSDESSVKINKSYYNSEAIKCLKQLPQTANVTLVFYIYSFFGFPRNAAGLKGSSHDELGVPQGCFPNKA